MLTAQLISVMTYAGYEEGLIMEFAVRVATFEANEMVCRSVIKSCEREIPLSKHHLTE